MHDLELATYTSLESICMASGMDPRLWSCWNEFKTHVGTLICDQSCIMGINSGALTIRICPLAVFRVTDAREWDSRGGTRICGYKVGICRVLSRLWILQKLMHWVVLSSWSYSIQLLAICCSREYLSGGSIELRYFWSESWCLWVIVCCPVSFNCSWCLGPWWSRLPAVLLSRWSFQTNVMSIDRKLVFRGTRLGSWNSGIMAFPRILTSVMSIDRKSVQVNVRLCGQNRYDSPLK